MKFDLSKYATVAERLTQAHADHPDLRIVTEVTNVDGEIGKTRWVVKTSLYLSAGDQANGLVKATGYAFEVDGTGGANATSALENCESSSIGRALMVAGYSMNKEPNALASREEMEKVARGAQHATLDWMAKLDEMDTKAEVRGLYAEALRNQAPKQVLDAITAKGKTAK
jgi:hypothetical protein